VVGMKLPGDDQGRALIGEAGDVMRADGLEVLCRRHSRPDSGARMRSVLQAIILAEILQTMCMPTGLRIPASSIAKAAASAMACGLHTCAGEAWPVSAARNATFIRRISSARS
jgi:hypothetical protein